MGNKMNELVNRLSGMRIEWYPSAGSDLMDVRSAFRHRCEHGPRPNVFIHTDWWFAEGDRDDFPDEIVDYEFKLRKVHEYPRLPAANHGFCVFGRGDVPNAGRCLEYEGVVKIGGREERFSLIKIAIENEQFAAEFLLPNQIHLEALVHKNCGWGCGGGATAPSTWMRGVLGRLQAKYFITDFHGMKGARGGHICWIEGEVPGRYEVSRVFPILGESLGERLSYQCRWEECWELGSPHGSVCCFAVGKYESESALKKSIANVE